jgi:serine/threonine protein kinase
MISKFIFKSRKNVHRDLKGANIFLAKDGKIKIGDFGISKAMDKTVLASKSFVGTPYYLSP